MSVKVITSGESATTVPGSTKPLNTRTRTTYTLDETGKIDPKSVKQEILYTQIAGDPPIVAATRNGSTGDFTFTKNSFTGKTIFGADAQKSLKEGALKTTTNQQIQQSAKKERLTPEQTKSISSTNATTDPNGGNESKPIEGLKPEDIFDGTNKGLPGAGKPYKYPKSMSARQDCIVFNMLEYSQRALTDTSATTGDNPLQLGQRSQTRTSLGSVRLPIQGGIVDGNAVVWGEDKMNALELFQINVAKQTIAGGFAEGLKTTEDGVKQDIPKSSMANLFAQAVTGKNVLARAEGAIVNENMELLFQSVTLRTFNFNFKMSARDPGEAKEIVNIIRFFKQGMAAKRTKNEYFLKSPNTFEIKYLHDGKDHPGINKIKECALQTCNVNYTPDGFYSAHYDGYLVTYDVSMQFQELEPVYNDEYSKFTDSVGY
jgi:hypothetical protein